MWTEEDLAAWRDATGEDAHASESHRVLSSRTLGSVRLKRRRDAAADEEEEEEEEEEGTAAAAGEREDKLVVRTSRIKSSESGSTFESGVGSLAPVPAASPPVGSLPHEFGVLSALHAHGVTCVPSFSVLLDDRDRHSHVLVQPQVVGSPLTGEFVSSRAVAAAVVAALREMHEAGVAHADLKPEHILVQNEGTQDSPPSICIVDFDLACFFQPTSDSPDHPARFLGTPAYAAIALHLGCAPSPATDCESLVWIFIELLVRTRHSDWRLPWRRNEESPVDDEAATAEAADGPAATINDTDKVATGSADHAPLTDGVDVDAAFTHLLEWLGAQSWGLSSVHRTGGEKIAAILGGTDGPTHEHESPAANALFVHLMHAVRAPLIQLTQLSQTAHEARDASNLLAGILDTLRERAQATPPPPRATNVRWILDDSTIARIENELHVRVARENSTIAPDDSHTHLAAPTWSGTTADTDTRIIALHSVEATCDHRLVLVRPSPSPSVVSPPPGDADADEMVQQYPDLCAMLTRTEERCGDAHRRPDGSCAPPISLLCADSRSLVVLPLPPHYSLGLLDRFFSSLLAAAFLFTLPRVHLAMQMERFCLLWPIDSHDDATTPVEYADEPHDDEGELLQSIDPGASWLHALLTQARASSEFE